MTDELRAEFEKDEAERAEERAAFQLLRTQRNELEREIRRLRDRCARLKRQRDWLKLNANRYESPTAKLGLPKP